nr:MAG TPA: hypothetical protein [Crassvirales sp.]
MKNVLESAQSQCSFLHFLFFLLNGNYCGGNLTKLLIYLSTLNFVQKYHIINNYTT